MRGVVQTWRDADLLAAGRYSGQTIAYLSLARCNLGGTRSLWVRAARRSHHRYLEAAKRAREQT